MPWNKSIVLGLRPGHINNKKKMTKEEFMDKVLPRTTMSEDEMDKIISEDSAYSAFSEAEKSARMMGDNSGIYGIITSEEVSEIASRLF